MSLGKMKHRSNNMSTKKRTSLNDEDEKEDKEPEG